MLNWRIASIFTIVLVLAVSLTGEYLLISKYGRFTGGDTALHLRLTEELLMLEYPGSSPYPYPPGFHLMLASLSMFFWTSPFVVMKVLQLFLLPLVVLATAYFVYKRTDIFTSAILVLLLLSSPAFWDRSSQVIPQALDLILLPLAYYYFLENKIWTFVAISTFLVYNHFAYTLLPIGGLFLYSFFNQHRFKEFAIIGVLSLPIIIYMSLNTSGIILESITLQNLQEGAVLRVPLFAIKYLGYPLFFLIYVAAFRQKFFEPTQIELLSRYWAISLIPMLVYFPDRFIEYFSQPVAMAGAVSISELVKGGRIRAIVLLALLVFTIVSLAAFYKALLTNGEVFLPLDSLSPFAA